MKQHEDQKYLTALLENDGILIKEIYRKHADSVKTYVLQNSGSSDDAKDLFQEVLIDLMRMTSKGFILNKPLRGYLLGMCRYKWIDKLKARKKYNAKMEVTILKNQRDSIERDHLFDSAFKKEQVHQLLLEKYNALPNHCQEIIGLRWIKNEATDKFNSLKDIANMLNRSYAYIRKEISQCSKKLRQAIKEDDRYSTF